MGRSARQQKLVLIACPPGDAHATVVALRLAELGVRAVPLDVGRLGETGFAARLGAGRPARCLVGADGRLLDPARATAVWWRRPKRFDAPAENGSRFGDAEWSCAIAGLVRVAGGFWVNDPAAEEAARHKIVQLEAARLAGLPVPRTLVTSDVASARAFVASCRRGAVMKSLSSLREGGYTRRVDRGDAGLADRLRAGPAIFQERADGLDVRVTVVGDALFAMSADAKAGGDPDDVRADWMRARSTARPVRVPAGLARRLVALHRRLGLRFGASDFRLRPPRSWAFLEVNPSGQWLHVEAATGHPIAAALARLLARGRP